MTREASGGQPVTGPRPSLLAIKGWQQLLACWNAPVGVLPVIGGPRSEKSKRCMGYTVRNRLGLTYIVADQLSGVGCLLTQN
jgi:hypothetical protein